MAETAGSSEMITVMEMKELLNIGRSKAYELIAQKRVPFCKIGSNIRIPKQLLLDHVQRAALNHAEIPEFKLDNVANIR